MQAGSTLNFGGLWGIQHTDVYAVASDFFTADWGVFHYDGNRWQEIVVDPAPLNRPLSVWGTHQDNVYVVGGFVTRFDGAKWSRVSVPSQNVGMLGIAGAAANDIIVCGFFGLVMHYNGDDWWRYDELLDLSGNMTLERVWMDANNAFIVGSTSAQAIVVRGRRQ
jgi:hypothetical protein